MVPFIIFCILNLVVSVISHKKIRNYLIACIVSSLICSLTYQIAGFFVMGGLDSFFLDVLVKSAMISFVFAVIVGIPFYRKRLKENSKNKCQRETEARVKDGRG